MYKMGKTMASCYFNPVCNKNGTTVKQERILNWGNHHTSLWKIQVITIFQFGPVWSAKTKLETVKIVLRTIDIHIKLQK